MTKDEIMERRYDMGERQPGGGLEPNEENEKAKRDEEHRKEGLSTGQRKKVGDPGYTLLVNALQDTTDRTLEHSVLQLTFEKTRHGDAMALARERLDMEKSQQDSFVTQQQKKIDIEEKRIVMEERQINLSITAMQTFSQVLAALASRV